MSAGLGLRRLFVLGIVTALGVRSGGDASAAKFNRKVEVGKPAPEWKGLAGVDGRKHSLDDYTRKPRCWSLHLCATNAPSRSSMRTGSSIS